MEAFEAALSDRSAAEHFSAFGTEKGYFGHLPVTIHQAGKQQ